MRPVQLGIGAFGPFLEHVQVDFAKLGAHQLFLIHGPIGSGKTTLLDAICFALYGCSSGGERTAGNMRNDLAETNQPTTVVFDFARGPTQYRVKRQLLGEVRSAQMWNLTGMDWPDPWSEPVLPPLEAHSSWDAVTQMVSQVLGLGEGEFRRSILIPQGQFRQLLSAPPAEREHILSALFNTAHQQILPALEDTANRLQEQLKLTWQKREDLANEMQLASGEDVLTRLDSQKKSLQHLEVEHLRFQQMQENFMVDAGRSAVFQERSQELQEAKLKLAELESREQELERKREALARYQAAEALGDYQQQLDQAQADLERAEAELASAQYMLNHPGANTDSPEKSIEDLQASQELHAELKSELVRLDEALAVHQAWHEACQQAQRQADQLEQLREQLLEVEEALHESQERMNHLSSAEKGQQQQGERIRTIQEKITELQRSLRRGQQQGDLRLSTERLRQYVSKAEQRCKEMEARILTLEEEILRLQGSSNQNQALFLASQLKSGEPCMVCGSTEHPHPARADAEPVAAPSRGFLDRSRERQSPQKLLESKTLQLKQAQALFKKLEAERSEQTLTLARLESRLETLQDETREDVAAAPALETSKSAIEENIARLNDELRLLERETAAKGKEENEKLRVHHRLQKLLRTRTDLETGLREAEMRLLQLQTRAQERQRQLAPGLESPEKIENHRQQILTDLESVAQDMRGGQASLIQSTGELAARQAALQTAERSVEMTRDRARLAREVYEARSEAAGFASLEEVDQSVKSFGDSPAEVQATVQRFQVDLGSARDRLERAQQLYNESLEDAGSVQDPQVLKERLEALVQEKSECQLQIRELQARSEEYQKCIEDIHSLEPQLSAARKLLRIASGENRLQLSFQQYLLSQHMENVLLAANHRLALMTRSRYSLETTGKGMELQVRDQVSGQVRPVATLSGGESFLASLALALGLSDSVSGGPASQAVEALFIDEGFGNLDDEALELAIHGLTQLRHEGRMVGVVSHLPELRERIPARLEVLSSPSGSRIQVVIHRQGATI